MFFKLPDKSNDEIYVHINSSAIPISEAQVNDNAIKNDGVIIFDKRTYSLNSLSNNNTIMINISTIAIGFTSVLIIGTILTALKKMFKNKKRNINN